MTNARYFADGTDFYRAIYSDGTTDGPYITFSSAKRQVGQMTKVRQRQTYYNSGVWEEWKVKEHGKVQKLVPMDNGTMLWLEWQDVES